ncbi:anthranilate synthase component I family protein [Stieleria sp. TO1_6]|uniref:anthranilate synthase component I family protein n=1 Tax=Stieleria tagensis TaxID=2956795 RepID=UPI00209A8C9F|nr:anthranilate synthase component I family protein [Stieleria tagensis]MCO8123432.1 anthranilate synthase component I family protein [Stieleria tagensis]
MNSQTLNALPIVVSLELPSDPDGVSGAPAVFRALRSMPGRIWFDSATAALDDGLNQDFDPVVRRLSRYSFLSADPVLRCDVFANQADPWGELARWAKRLPATFDPALPPFQGGLAGVVGYEAARWLEPHELARCADHQNDDLPTPAVSLGVYDFVIAIDHFTDQAWLICQGFSGDEITGRQPCSPLQRGERAALRAEQVRRLLAAEIHEPETAESDLQSSRGKRMAVQTSSLCSNFSSQDYRNAVADIVRRIRCGDSFQVNLAQRLTTAATIESDALYLRLRRANPAPYAGYYDGGAFQVLSSSPEGFLRLRQRHVETRPIKGTVPRTGDAVADGRLADHLLGSDKDRAENIMIVDLMRNDLSRVCQDESVVVSQLCEIERYQFVQHLVSVVEGDLRADCDAVDLLRACFPGGSVTGAPKIEAMKTIAELEPNPRGPYCGSMGYIGCGGFADFNILIRTITATAGRWQIPVGGGITARSNPVDEEAETWAKAQGMLHALPQ